MISSTPPWQWQSWNNLPYLTCSLLKDWQHGFFTQQFYPQTPEVLTEILKPDTRAYRVKQVHGNRVLTPGEIIPSETEADGIISDRPHQSVWVASADCTPLLIADRKTGRVGSLHAGWRGTAKGIAPVALERFLSLGSRLEDLYCVMGPAIAGAVYQVTETVAAEIGSSLKEIPQTDSPREVLAALESINHSPLHPDPTPGRVRIDVRQVNYLQLRQAGIDPEQIAIAPYCTYQQTEHFFSFRRTKEKKVQWSGIVSPLTCC